MVNIVEHIKGLEERLLHTDVRKNSDLIDELLSDEFEEVGSIGKISSRDDVIHWLVNKEKDIMWSLTDFKVRELSHDLVLAVYRANKKDSVSGDSLGSIRSSIWKKYGSNWKMIFHQGTKILDG